MSVILSFMDNEVYGADDINRAFSKLTTQGVSLFNYQDGDDPLISLNDAVANYTGAGIELYNVDACKVVYDDMTEKFYILCGNAFMCDGSMITIDNEPYDITDKVREIRKTYSGNIYVYFKREVGANTIDINVCREDEYSEDELCVPLGEIMPDNDIHDIRRIAVSKVASCGGNVTKRVELTIPRMDVTNTFEQWKRVTIENVFPGAKYVIVRCMDDGGMEEQLEDVCECEIQNLSEEDTQDLNYVFFNPVYKLYIAFNRSGTDIQVWMKVATRYISERRYIFNIF